MGLPVGRAKLRAIIVVLSSALLVLIGDPLSSATGSATTAAVAGAAALASPTLAASPYATVAAVSKRLSPGVRDDRGTGPAPGPGDISGIKEGTFTVLCYHQFGEQPENGDPKKNRRSLYKISRSEFEWQMQYLKDHGIIPISLTRVKNFIEKGTPIPERAVLITFDDGFRSIYTDAYPILRKYKYPAVLFAYTDFLEGQSASLRWDEIREMLKNGFELGGHGQKHLNLAKESLRQTPADFRLMAIRELHDSAKSLEARLGVRPDALAYPYGVYTKGAMEEARRVGYRLAFSINPGSNDRTIHPMLLRRHLITYFTRRDLFAKIFESKVLHLEQLQPADGGIVWVGKPVISAVFRDDVDPKSVSLQIGQRPLPCKYDATTRRLTKPMLFALKRGGHQVTLTARERSGIQRVYSWYFRVERKSGREDDASEDLIPGDPGMKSGQDRKKTGKKAKKPPLRRDASPVPSGGAKGR